jgi:hypothetical protein
MLMYRHSGLSQLLLTFGSGLVLPVLGALGWVYASTYLAIQKINVGQDSGVRLAPFAVMTFLQGALVSSDHVYPWLVAKFLLSILFPASVAICFFSQVRSDPRMVLAWLQFGVGVIFTYFLAEYPDLSAANFIWSGHITLFVLFVVSALMLIEQTLTDIASPWRAVFSNRAAIVCYGALLLHLIGGFGLFRHPTWWWWGPSA